MAEHDGAAEARRSPTLVVGLVSGVLVVGLMAVGVMACYHRVLEPQSYAERGCNADGANYVACVDERMRDGPLTPGAPWFMAALVVLVVGVSWIAWQRWNTRDQRAPDIGAAEQALSEPEARRWGRDGDL